MATHTLNNGKLKLVVNETGGCVDSFQYINGFTFDVLRARVNTSNGFAGDSSMFPMLPMANRIRGNQFVWRGHKVVLLRLVVPSMICFSCMEMDGFLIGDY
ncbi:hypothetical protein PWW31_19310 [Vibrio harveyi]|nr:hypothetical protein PWW31_19310 [Vibrio harveyi]